MTRTTPDVPPAGRPKRGWRRRNAATGRHSRPYYGNFTPPEKPATIAMKTTSLAPSFRRTAACGVLAALILASGCAPLGLKENPFREATSWFSRDDKPRVPAKVVAVWSDTVRYKQGTPPTRGFAGRLVFYRSDQKKPVKVDGTLVVYAFDEDGRSPTNPRPDRKYIFKPDQLPAHYSQSKLGHSYSFFLPWDELGEPRKEISLIVRFQPVGGPAVVGESTRHLLAGPDPPPPVEQAGYQQQPPPAGNRQPVRTASFDQRLPASGGSRIAKQRQRMRTTTIDIPARFGRASPVARVRPRFTRARPATAAAGPAPSSPAGSSRPAPPPTRSSLSRLRPLGAPIAQLTHGRARWQPRPAMWQSPKQSPPRSASGSQSRQTAPSATPDGGPRSG